MPEPLLTITAVEIATIAFYQFIKSATGEVTKQLTKEVLEKSDVLRLKIIEWFNKGDHPRAQKAITEIQEHQSSKALNKIITYLDDEMDSNPDFRDSLHQLLESVSEVYVNEQVIGEGLEGENIEIQQVEQINQKGSQGNNKQTIGKQLKASKTIKLKNIKQKG